VLHESPVVVDGALSPRMEEVSVPAPGALHLSESRLWKEGFRFSLGDSWETLDGSCGRRIVLAREDVE
jgi:type II restriction/modification system DNA methylase subunit YeeA